MAERVFIVRHGETAWSVNGRHTGKTELALTPHGAEQARALAGSFVRERFALVLCSPLWRARQTCELAGLGGQAVLCEDLIEWDYGDYEGLTTPQIRQRDPRWNLWRDGCPRGELPADVGARADRALALLRDANGQAIAFAHGHILRVLTARWLSMEPAAGAHFMLSAGAVSILGYERETEVIQRWNA